MTGILALPCPFCGGSRVSVVEGGSFRWRVAQCDECGAQCGEVRIQTLGSGTKEQWEEEARGVVIKEWNSRVAEAGLRCPPREPRIGTPERQAWQHAKNVAATAALRAIPINEGWQDRVPGSEPASESARDTATIPAPPSPNQRSGGTRAATPFASGNSDDTTPSPDAPAPDTKRALSLLWGESPHMHRVEIADAIERLTAELAEARRERDDHAAYCAGIERELNVARNLCKTLRNEAQAHAQEARTANATIAEIYRACTGGKGEPGNWHGALPVIATIERLTAELAERTRERDEQVTEVSLARESLQICAKHAGELEAAQAEVERLRACVEAADAMRGSYLSRYIDEYDTARAAIDAGRNP
jgi:hypothetical protein